jgi:hypothetical protein
MLKLRSNGKKLIEWLVFTQEAKYVERWPGTTSARACWSRFDISVERNGGVHSLLICTSSPMGFPTCHGGSQQENTYGTKYQKADRASILVTLWYLLWRDCNLQYDFQRRDLWQKLC